MKAKKVKIDSLTTGIEVNGCIKMCPFKTQVPIQGKETLIGGQPNIGFISQPCTSQCAMYQERDNVAILHCGNGFGTYEFESESPLKLN